MSGERFDSEDRLIARKVEHPELDVKSAAVFLHQLGVDKFESTVIIRRVLVSLLATLKNVHLSSVWDFAETPTMLFMTLPLQFSIPLTQQKISVPDKQAEEG